MLDILNRFRKKIFKIAILRIIILKNRPKIIDSLMAKHDARYLSFIHELETKEAKKMRPEAIWIIMDPNTNVELYDECVRLCDNKDVKVEADDYPYSIDKNGQIHLCTSDDVGGGLKLELPTMVRYVTAGIGRYVSLVVDVDLLP